MPPKRILDRVEPEDVDRQPRQSQYHLLEKIYGPVMLAETRIDVGEDQTGPRLFRKARESDPSLAQL